MKNVIIISLVLTGIAALTPSAFAMHAYYEMSCTNNKLQFRYKGNYPVGGDYGISLKGSDFNVEGNELLILPSDSNDVYGQEELDAASVVYKTLYHKNRKPHVEFNDGCFDHTEWKSRVKIKLERVSPEATAKLGIVKNQVLSFECKESTDYPNPKDCE